MKQPIAIISGALRLPFLVRDSLKKQGYAPYVIGLKNYADPKLKPDLMVRLGAGGAIFRELKKRDIKQVMFVGAIGHPKFSDIRPDLWTFGMVARILTQDRGYDSLGTALLREVEKKGLKIVAAQDLCPDLTLPAGTHTKTKPNAQDKRDIARAIEVSKIIGAADIGHAAVVDKLVLGVEGAEGTKGLLERIAILKKKLSPKKSGVLAKMIKPGQDLRIDTTAIGADTIKEVAAAGLRGIVVDAKKCLIIDRDEVIKLSNKLSLFLTTI
ncbi:MAG: UDP-2,3-diacylglucosamine diphosphatase LpxI [Rickettsiales bacterium]|jgi:DUF1009 family protein|nr:UDP-2,3-diacylglucosamine diphosphatase LpxI [Rickettsiales bacterium]